jgi:soluble lytic murein transglycosylase-like protein
VAVLSTPRGRGIAGAVVATVVVLVALTACGNPAPVFHDAAAAPSDSASASPSPVVPGSPSEPPSPPPSPTVAPTPAKKKAPPPKPKPVQVAHPPPSQPHDPPPKTPKPGASCPTYSGPVAPRSDVAAAISAASQHPFKPKLNGDGDQTAISVRLALIQGVAWEESGWQSTILACDGGVGTMQVMPNTASWMNEKYDTSYDFHTLTGNVMVGTGYLAWLTQYFGETYFGGNYSLMGDPNKLVLLDLVLSGYQAGFGKVDEAMAAGKDLPNTWYVYTVEGFMTNQPWNS